LFESSGFKTTRKLTRFVISVRGIWERQVVIGGKVMKTQPASLKAWITFELRRGDQIFGRLFYFFTCATLVPSWNSDFRASGLE
jgi:hypothetical protein